MEPRVSCMLGSCSITELYFKPCGARISNQAPDSSSSHRLIVLQCALHSLSTDKCGFYLLVTERCGHDWHASLSLTALDIVPAFMVWLPGNGCSSLRGSRWPKALKTILHPSLLLSHKFLGAQNSNGSRLVTTYRVMCREGHLPLLVGDTYPCRRAVRTNPLRFWRMRVVVLGTLCRASPTPPTTIPTRFPVPWLSR